MNASTEGDVAVVGAAQVETVGVGEGIGVAWILGRMASTARVWKALLTRRRRRVWSGGSANSMILVWRSSRQGARAT